MCLLKNILLIWKHHQAEIFIGTHLALEQGGIHFMPHLVWHSWASKFFGGFVGLIWKTVTPVKLPSMNCKRYWWSVFSPGLIERHSIWSTLLQNVMLRKKAPYNFDQCISVFNKCQFESIGSFSLVWNSHWNPCYNYFFLHKIYVLQNVNMFYMCHKKPYWHT